MIWFFIISSVVFILMGIVFLVAPQKLLFLMPEVDQQRLMESGPYRMIARNRYALFGRADTCIIPSAEQRHRFVL